MSEQKLYSPEPFDDPMLELVGFNGDILRSVSFNRNNRNSSAYVEIKTNCRLIPTVIRSYYDDNGSLQKFSKVYAIIEPTNGLFNNIVFDYDEHNDYRYVSYRLEFEVIGPVAIIEVNQIGVVFDTFDMVTSTVVQYFTKLLTDINNKPLSKQEYTKVFNYSIICNSTDKEEVLNVIEKPYYFVNILDGCINNSSKLLVEQGITISYITSATKMIEIKVNNLVGK